MADRPTSSSARKRLPVNPSLEHLQKQAKRHAKQQPDLTLAKAQHELAKAYGCRDWVELTRVVATMNRQASRDAFEELPKAANAQDLDRIKAILASGEFTQHDLDLALARSVLRFDERGEIARLLLDHGADPDGQYGSAGYGPIVFVTGEGLDPEGLAFLLDAGCDVTFPPIDTKYGKHGVMSHWLGTYVRGRNEPKHRGLSLLLDAGAPIPEHVTPEMMAIHLGDTTELGRLLDANPDLVHRRYPDMPYGNMRLRGATLLHLAIDFQEAECVDLLLDRGANINAQADVVTDDEGDAFGGQSPIFHAIGSWMGHGRSLLKSLVERLGNDINWIVKGRIKFYDGVKGPFSAQEWLLQNADELAIVRAVTHDDGSANAGLDRDTLDSFGKALVGKGGDIDRVRRMLDREPRLASCNPWSPGWAGSAVEAVAGMCVWHKPAEHAIARLLVERGATCSLQTAARAGLLSEVKREADERGWVFNEVDVKGRTLMYRAACVYGKFHEGEAVADYLIEKGARVDLFSACTLGMLDRVQALLADDASLATKPDPEGMTALHWAVRNRRNPDNAAPIVAALLDAGADLEAVNSTEDGMRPLHHCGEWSSPPEVVDLLLDRGADVNALATESRWTPLDYAIDSGRDDMAELLRQRGGKRRDDLDLREAVASGDVDGVSRRLDANPALLAPALWPPAIFQARSLPMTRMLLDRGLDPNQCAAPRKPLHLAVDRGLVDIVALLLDRGADPDVVDGENLTPLELAAGAVSGQRPPDADRSVALLRRAGAAVTPFTALLLNDDAAAIAAFQGDPSWLRVRGWQFFTPLAAAARAARRPVVEWLLDAGVAPDAADDGENSPLWFACQSDAPPDDRIEVARLLLDRGADPNRRCEEGTTPLHFAAWRGPAAMVRLLIERGGDADAADQAGRTPLDYALDRGRDDTAEVLRSSGGKTRDEL